MEIETREAVVAVVKEHQADWRMRRNEELKRLREYERQLEKRKKRADEEGGRRVCRAVA